MQTDNIIQQNSFHVEEDFYEEIINGLQAAKDREQARKKKQPIVILPRQARFITYVTTPIMVKESSGFIESISRFQFQKERLQAANGLRNKFLKAWGKITEVNEEVDDELKAINKKGFSIFKVTKVLKTLRSIARIYTAIKAYKKPKVAPFELNLEYLSNPVYFSEFDAHFTEVVHAQGNALIPVLFNFIYPTAKQLFTLYDKKLEELYVSFNWWLFRMLIFDYKDPFAYGAELLSIAIGLIATKLTRNPALGKGAYQAIRGLIQGVKLKKFVSRVKGVFSGFQKVHWSVRASGNFIKASGLAKRTYTIQRVGTPMSRWERGKLAYKTAKKYTGTSKFFIKGGIILYSGIDLIDVTKEDVEEYNRYFSRVSRVMGSRFEANYSDDLTRMINMGVDMFDFADDTVSKINESMRNSASNDDEITQVLSEKFERQVIAKGFDQLKITKILNALIIKFNLMWTKIHNSLERQIFSENFSMNGNLVYGQKKIIFGEENELKVYFGEEKNGWDCLQILDYYPRYAVGGEKMLWARQKNMVFYKNNQIVSEKYFHNGTDYKNERNRKRYIAKHTLVKRGSFKRIITQGFATGFKLNLINNGEAVKLEDYKVISNPYYSAEYLQKDNEGNIVFSQSVFRDSIFMLNSIVEHTRKLIEEENKTKDFVVEITEMLKKGCGGYNTSTNTPTKDLSAKEVRIQTVQEKAKAAVENWSASDAISEYGVD